MAASITSLVVDLNVLIEGQVGRLAVHCIWRLWRWNEIAQCGGAGARLMWPSYLVGVEIFSVLGNALRWAGPQAPTPPPPVNHTLTNILPVLRTPAGRLA